MKKSKSIGNKIKSLSLIFGILVFWQLASRLELLPKYMLPSPVDVVKALITDFPTLMVHAKTSLIEAFSGLFIGVALGFLSALLMDRFDYFERAFYPILVITQTIPTVAIAPLLVLWMGYGIAPKITLIVIVTFFPIAIGLFEGFRSADKDRINLLKAMGASQGEIFKYVKLPNSLNQFFAALKISASYSIVGAVIAEWLGGYEGLGVYMMRVKKSFSYDKMFAVIFLISALSLALMSGVTLLKRLVMPWENRKREGVDP